MLPLLAALLLVQPPRSQGTARPADTAKKVVVDSATRARQAQRDSILAARRRGEPARKGIPVTAEHERTAFRDRPARDVLLRARAARMRQDSALQAYDAKSYQRLTIKFGVRRVGFEKTFMRSEQASRVRWQRGVGAWVDALGARAAAPAIGGGASMNLFGIASIPYYPGKETLWFGSGGLARAEVDEQEIVHPLARGSEAYYQYRSGDSVAISLGGGRRITLRELEIIPRRPAWNLVVGSFWFDVGTGQLVRAVYRLAKRMDIKEVAERDEPDAFEDVPLLVKGMIFPMEAEVEAVTIEYGLFNGFWMPRTHSLQAWARAGTFRVPVTLEERYKYESVNVRDSVLPPIPAAPRRTRDTTLTGEARIRDSARVARRDSARAAGDSSRDDDIDGQLALGVGEGDPAKRVAARRARRDTVRTALRNGDTATVRRLVGRRRLVACDTADTRLQTGTRGDGALRVAVRASCDPETLEHSPEFTGSLFDANEELFGVRDREELEKELDIGLQSLVVPQAPVWAFNYADGAVRYNRVEGLSVGPTVRWTMGGGYLLEGTARIATEDLVPQAELSAWRTDGRTSYGITGYRRLAVASDWGSPLGFGASVANLLYARDEGFYYRSWGAELARRPERAAGLSWRLFAEKQYEAPVASRFSLFRGARDDRFLPNTPARETPVAGLDARWRRGWGMDPRGLRLFADVRTEGGYGGWMDDSAGGFGYGRAFADLTLARAIAGPVAASLTAAAGSSLGELPAQRRYFVGGLHTVRGQTAGTGAGESFWFGRAEVGTAFALVRPAVFFDLGWAGNRGDWGKRRDALGNPLVPMRGTGVGLSFLDGLVRFDVARGLYPRRQWRADLLFEARF